jgi:hypothetical protein
MGVLARVIVLQAHSDLPVLLRVVDYRYFLHSDVARRHAELKHGLDWTGTRSDLYLIPADIGFDVILQGDIKLILLLRVLK